MFNLYLRKPSLQFCRKYFSKFYKITFSGLDKYVQAKDLKKHLSEINEITLLRINKSSHRNYGHADINSGLDLDKIKEKLECIKISGKNLKVRVKEIDDDE